MLVKIEIHEDTAHDLKQLLKTLSFLSKCSIDPNIKTEEIETIFENLGQDARKILDEL